MKSGNCPKCNSTDTMPIGYSIVDIAHACNDCEHEWDTERDYENGDTFAEYLKSLVTDTPRIYKPITGQDFL